MIQRLLRGYRQAYEGLSPSVWLLAGVMLINRCGTMVLPFLTLYMTQQLHYSLGQAGVVMGIFGAGAFIGTFLGGRLTDRFGFYYIQLGSLLFGGLALLGLQFVTNFYALCASVFLFTLLGDSFRPANQAALAYYATADTRTRAFSLNRLAINLGWAVGGGLGGLLAGIDYDLLFWADGCTCLLAGLVLWWRLPVPMGQGSVNRPAVAAGEPVVGSAYRDRIFLLFAGFVLLYLICFMQLFSMVPLYFRQELHLSEQYIGLLMSLNGILIVVIEMALVYGIEQRNLNRTYLIAGGVLLSGLAYLTLSQAHSAGMALAFVLIVTLSEMLAMPFMQAFAAGRSSAHNRGQYLALYGMAGALAQTSAPTLGSQISGRFGFEANWLLMVGISLVSAAGFWWIGQKTTHPAPTNPPAATPG